MEYSINYFIRLLLSAVVFIQINGCTTPQPKYINNVCSIFLQYPKWYWATQSTESKWGVPIPVQMAIIHQESGFSAKAKPNRTRLLWIIPWKRPSTAYGYTQALKTTWEHYLSTQSERRQRDSFSDASDFIGWYAAVAKERAGIPSHDAYKLYLAYHEGVGGYINRTYHQKQWLIPIAEKVQRQAIIYSRQLTACQSKLKKKPWYRRLWS